METRRLAVYLLAYQGIWAICVLYPATLWGVALATGYIAIHGVFNPRDLQWIVLAMGMGWSLDSLPVVLNWLSYAPHSLPVAPLWIALQWGMFSILVRVTLGFLHFRLRLAGLIGGLLAPFAYWGGSQLGAVSFYEPAWALGLIGVNWMVALPLLCYLVRRRTPPAKA